MEVMYAKITPQVNLEVIIIVIVKNYGNKHKSIKKNNVNFTQGPYDDFPCKWLMKNGTPGGGGKPHMVDSE